MIHKFFLSKLFLLINILHLFGQNHSNKEYTTIEIEEFEILNLCHCYDYLRIKDIEYTEWKSEFYKKQNLNDIQKYLLGTLLSKRLHNQYYQNKFDSTIILKQAILPYYGSKFDFTRLDSMYYEPIVQYYIQAQREKIPYLGLGDVNFFFDCYFKVKEIPLKQELYFFYKLNKIN